MWIDALCINQENDVEKGSHVRMMAEIYRVASRVVVWLGPEENDSNRAMELIEYLGSQTTFNYLHMRLKPSEVCTDPTLCDRDVPLPFNEGELAAIYCLISRQWFERLWVRQEIWSANKDAITRCGSQQLIWTCFRQGLFCFLMRCAEDVKNNVWSKFGGLVLAHLNVELIGIRLVFGTLHCKDPRDRIYAISAMLPDEEQAFIPHPNYSQPFVELYTHAILQWIGFYNSLNILHVCELQNKPSWPSWVPNWSIHSRMPVKISPQHASSQLRCWHQQPQPGTLRVKGISGFVIDRHHKLQLNRYLSGGGTFNLLREILRGLGPIERDSIERYARTFSMGQVSDMCKPPIGGRLCFDIVAGVVRLLMSDYEFDDLFEYDYSGGDNTLSAKDPDGVFNVLIQFCKELDGLLIFQGGTSGIGIGSQLAKSGDEVCVIVGCNCPLLLRPISNGQYKLVGPCFVDDLKWGEAILGPSPKGIRPVFADTDTDSHVPAFMDSVSGAVSFEDPRLKSLPIDLSDFRRKLSKNPWAKIDVDPDLLGVELQCFDLV
ncbi:HET-domain-containing protein [Hypoxylon trugodes]|uniref:HET-domain-containing protein n=1 Tax=Hypoxylon trugodes TaxID=326681 RepID=UPI00218CA3D9|nr:HET-domain-containing protein [Hypoxylon trugodes]KAI1384614.1 HET-domain-containing protein [Hypoxylon trugodes]